MKKFVFKLWADRSSIYYYGKPLPKESLGTVILEWKENDLQGAWDRIYHYRERSNRIRQNKSQQLIGDIDLLEEAQQ